MLKESFMKRVPLFKTFNLRPSVGRTVQEANKLSGLGNQKTKARQPIAIKECKVTGKSKET